MSLPLASFPIAKTSDSDEAQAVLSRELSDLRFRSVCDPSSFRFEMNGVRLGRTMVACNQFATKTDVDAGIIEDVVIVSFSLGPPTVVDLDGEQIDTSRVAVVSPEKRLKIYRTSGSGVVMLRAGLDSVKERFRELTGIEPTQPFRFDSSVDSEQGIGAQIRRSLDFLLGDSANTDTILNNPILRTALDDMLLSSILALPNSYSDRLIDGARQQVAPRLVHRAEQFMEANARRPITIADVVAECDCSRSALYQAFRRHNGYTPLQFLEQSRLASARQALLSPCTSDSVASIALSCGFAHLGRFAAAYRARYGEKPSDTLRNA